MAYSSNPLWPPTQPTGLDSQVGGLFHNLETQDDLLDFHEPAKVRPLTSTWHRSVDISRAYNRIYMSMNDAGFMGVPDAGLG